jgi:hypothetical protein
VSAGVLLGTQANMPMGPIVGGDPDGEGTGRDGTGEGDEGEGDGEGEGRGDTPACVQSERKEDVGWW